MMLNIELTSILPFGILAKLYLNAEVYTGTDRYSDAAAAAGYIIDNGPYSLSDSGISVP